MSDPSPLIPPEALAARLGEPGLVLIDCTSTWPGGPEIELEGSIPGAVALDIDAVSDRASPLPHMLPSPADFEAFARAAGVGRDSAVVVYDRLGLVSAPRGWWMFRAMGHRKVQVLDGGLPAWIRAGCPSVHTPAATRASAPGDFVAKLEPSLVADRGRVADALGSARTAVADVRSKARFEGGAPEPRPGVRSGHMPGARNTPWAGLIGPDGRMLPPESLAVIFAHAGVPAEASVITSCGSGVTACIAALALEQLGRDWAVYDGSWAEWGSREDAPVAQGPA